MNEELVNLFLENKIKYGDIVKTLVKFFNKNEYKFLKIKKISKINDIINAINYGKKFENMNFLAKFLLLFILLPFSKSLAEKIDFTQVKGNQRISIETINEIIDFKSGIDYSFSNINEMQKKLFNTEVFLKILILRLKKTN